ncbi:DUF1569 domain-containing protein [Psychroserpens ponticola]|uniref:DUF1569 domain-containing protein n=1 Tax=Psychroserpens ponticola TaxID=2932268 RepID=A0ABY7S072_9FLAO|nr:DUF1569 domain-containing protein [Psychroserpens ponticola]WCO02331.1 DUF1569 domain-containing protein [Psychroserpens ponticola]
MKSLFTTEAHNEIMSRIEKLNTQAQPKWGKMNANQMLAHCSFPLQVALQELKLAKPNVVKRLLFSMFKASLYDDKPWKKSLPTTKQFIVHDSKDFTTEKSNLLEKITQFHNEKSKIEWPPHPMFGKFTNEQWGKMQYKHLDHHLKQFGV